MRVLLMAALPCLLLSSCSVWFFSGEEWVDRTRPVALVETTGGIEFGATTEFGVLTLGRSAASGPCRVHYFLGPTPLIESGQLVGTSSVFTRADIELKTQLLRCLDRSATTDDRLLAMWTPDGTTLRTVKVQLAARDGLAGDLLVDPGEPLPAGATVLCRANDETWLFAGLVSGVATVRGGNGSGRFYVFAGPDRVRELMATPSLHPADLAPKYRTDDIWVQRPRPPLANPPAANPDELPPSPPK
jgi:hypothetical protein